MTRPDVRNRLKATVISIRMKMECRPFVINENGTVENPITIPRHTAANT